MNLGKDMFISDDARTSLNLVITEDEFNKLKQHVNNDSKEKHKCFINNHWYNHDEGIFIPKELMANAIEKNLEATDKVWHQFKTDKIIICPSCSKKFNYASDKVLCPYCNHLTVVKKYGKRIKLPQTKKITFKLYIKYLRGKTKSKLK